MPKRLTYHPSADVAAGWTPDGKKVLFSSNRNSYSRFAELYLADLNGGLEEKLPLPAGYDGSFAADGKHLAYVPMGRAFSAWKRYRGGMTTPIWLADLSTSKGREDPA